MAADVRRLRAGYYVVTGLTTLATSYYFNYLFFLLRDRFAFGDRQNLWMSALHGGIYIVAAWQCGRFAERRGYHTSLVVGLSGLLVCMIAGGLVATAALQVAVLAGYTTVLLFIWPALEALVTEHQAPERMPHAIGLYNCTWSGAAAVAYFTGGTLYDHVGSASVFWVPALLFGSQLPLVAWLARTARSMPAVVDASPPAEPVDPGSRPARVHAPTFLRLAWLANPFSYVAIYTLFAVMPGVAQRLGLSPTRVGLFCSIWLFGRLAAFGALWKWTGWHYRFRWMLGAYVVLSISFVAIVVARSLSMLVAGEVGFGVSAGLIYYSSLFYSMDAGAAKAEHGGLHEAAIGLGICAGPAVGALSLSFFPTYPRAATVAVTVLLATGLALLITMWRGASRRLPAART
ncbi:MAG: MFS transporter [Vicinamibacterales bacterium]